MDWSPNWTRDPVEVVQMDHKGKNHCWSSKAPQMKQWNCMLHLFTHSICFHIRWLPDTICVYLSLRLDSIFAQVSPFSILGIFPSNRASSTRSYPPFFPQSSHRFQPWSLVDQVLSLIGFLLWSRSTNPIQPWPKFAFITNRITTGDSWQIERKDFGLILRS